MPDLVVVHYGDPWCWYSWGLEPVLQRLHEVYGAAIEINYRMGGVFSNLNDWRKEYGVEEDQAMSQWISESDKMMRNPFNLDYVFRSGMKSTWLACIAVKAAQLQGQGSMMKFYRKLMETIQVYAQDCSNQEALKKVARDSGLDLEKFSVDLHGDKALSMFEDDKNRMKADGANFHSLVIENRNNGKRAEVSGYTSEKYEQAIEEISGGALPKRMPIDIIEYFDQRKGLLLTAREISEVFKIAPSDAEKRLRGLAESGVLKDIEVPEAGRYWVFSEDMNLQILTLEQVKLSHVTEHAKVSEPAQLEQIVENAVQRLYTEVAEKPQGTFHFPVGREGALLAGYPPEQLDMIPKEAVESFAGVNYPHATESIMRGDLVLDVGSGSGTDIFVAALKTGNEGSVIGLDFTDAMITKARRNISNSRFSNIKIIKGQATKIPMEVGSVDVVTSNGVLNLVPNKRKAFEEIFRVLKPGGRLQLADIIVKQDVQKVCGIVPQLWADCIGGASVESDYLSMLGEAGFTEINVIRRFDYFSKSNSEGIRRLTKTFGAESIAISARKPG